MQNGDIWENSCQCRNVFSQILGNMGQCFGLEEEITEYGIVGTWTQAIVGLICLFVLSDIIGYSYRVKFHIKCIKVASSCISFVVCVSVCVLGILASFMAKFIVHQEKNLSKEKRPYAMVFFFFFAIIKLWERIMINTILLMVPKAALIYTSGKPIFHSAVCHGYVDMVDTLVGWFSNYKRNTVLDKRIFTDLQKIVDEWLDPSHHVDEEEQLARRVSILITKPIRELCDMDGNTALHMASERNYPKCVQVLLTNSNHEYREMVNSNKDTALHLACGRRRIVDGKLRTYESCARLLLQYSRPEYREMRNSQGNTALHLAANIHNAKCVEMLLKGARRTYREMKNLRGETALFRVCCDPSRKVKCLPYLLKNSRAEYREMQDLLTGDTSLHRACAGANLEAIQLLLENSRPCLYEIENYANRKAVQCIHRDHAITGMLLTIKYMRIMQLLSANTLYVIDDNDMFWCADSIIKDTLPWLIGFESYDLPPRLDNH
eukprot:TRINITY_DN12946_c0_g1_i3.p1 TRINITY_DN12946_c0_g1~~TRINITY_DN12946_c0_g1_i3.p1  ORF type:complete len:492 (-),score=27.21 TRINITY_DN12946_c0_g1_i3:28-1503(-)